MKCCRCNKEVNMFGAALNMACMEYHIETMQKGEDNPLCLECAIALNLFMLGHDLVDESLFVALVKDRETDDE